MEAKMRGRKPLMNVRIKAIRQTVYHDLMAQYENPIEHACDIHEGQEWISVKGKRPEGLCRAAWESMSEFVESLAHGKGNFYKGWMKNPMSAMISCNDGFRPVSFYIEAIEEPEAIIVKKEEKNTIRIDKRPKPLTADERLEARVQKVVKVIGKAVVPRCQLVADLGLRQQSRHTFLNNYLRPARERGLVNMTYPDTPSKPEQAYRLTAQGLILYRKLTEK